MTPERCKRCHQFMPRYGQHRCPCDDWQHRRDRSARHRYATALALSLFVGGFGLLYVGTQIPDMTLPAPRTVSDAVPGQSGAPLDPASVPAALQGDDPGVGAPSEPAAATPVLSPPVDEPIVTSMPASSPPDTATATIRGRASWYAANGDQGAVPWWRFGMDPVWATVTRFADGRTYSVAVLVTGFCQCYVGTPQERVIDLSDNAFRQLAPLSVGLIRVTVEIAEQGPRVTPPATESEEMGVNVARLLPDQGSQP